MLLNKTIFCREDRRDSSKLYNKMEVGDLVNLDPVTPWLDYINTLLDGVVVIDNKEVVIVDVPAYIKDLRSNNILAHT